MAFNEILDNVVLHLAEMLNTFNEALEELAALAFENNTYRGKYKSVPLVSCLVSKRNETANIPETYTSGFL